MEKVKIVNIIIWNDDLKRKIIDKLNDVKIIQNNI
jgi:hypothetical protein